MTRIAVIDFETTGLSPAMGDRATEVAIVMLDGGEVVGRFQSLMNAGVHISPFIESFTGISNAMVAAAPPAAEVMAAASRFVGDAPMVAHNASFDRRYWQAELARAGLGAAQPFACTVLLSRRLYPEARSHSLGAMAAHHSLPSAGRAHRALADAEVAAALLLRIQADLCERFGLLQAHHELLMKVQSCQRHALASAVKRFVMADNGLMKMQRVVVKTSLHPKIAGASPDLQFWLSQPVQARLAAVEELRRQQWGAHAERRLQRVCRITSLKPG